MKRFRRCLLLVSPLLMGCGSEADLIQAIADDGLAYVEGVQPRDPAPGQILRVDGFGFGQESGQIGVVLPGASRAMALEIQGWTDERIAARVPEFTLTDPKGFETFDPVDSRLVIVRSDGSQPAYPTRIQIRPATVP